MVGNALASGDSVYEIDDDIELVGQALPFGLKLTESLLAQSPQHEGLLLTASRGFVLYAHGYVHYEAELAEPQDVDRARVLRTRACKLYLRGLGYGFRALERHYPGLERKLVADPRGAVEVVGAKTRTRDVPLLYWAAAALGLAISVSPDDATMLARLPEVEALLDRALALDESWDAGTLHEFKIILAGSKPGMAPDVPLIKRQLERALELSKGSSAGLYLAYAEAVSLPAQNTHEFREVVEKALALDPDQVPGERLLTLMSQRRARWLLSRIEDLILDDEIPVPVRGVR